MYHARAFARISRNKLCATIPMQHMGSRRWSYPAGAPGQPSGASSLSLIERVGPLQKDDPTPLYLQLQKILRDAIEGQVVKAEEAIPTERDLAEEFEVSRITVRKAIDGLVGDGIVTRRRGAGTFVKIGRAHV